MAVPIDGSYTYAHSDIDEAVLDVNINRNRQAIHEFIYGEHIPRSAN